MKCVEEVSKRIAEFPSIVYSPEVEPSDSVQDNGRVTSPHCSVIGVIHAGYPSIRGDAAVFVSKHGGDISAHPSLYVTCRDAVRVLPWLVNADRPPSWRMRATEVQR